MNCHYCDRIRQSARDYTRAPAIFDAGSETPRCKRHWRFTCGVCGRRDHFQSMAFCPKEQAPFCRKCALTAARVARRFWAWDYYWNFRCPICALDHPSLDYAEYSGGPLPPDSFISPETFLARQSRARFVPVSEGVSDQTVGSMWSENADTWSKLCGPEGDAIRKYVTDPVLFRLLGQVRGETVLDAGCGEGYLSRILAEAGAEVWGVENAKGLFERAEAQEERKPLGIRYVNGSISAMPEVSSGNFDAVVCNNVMMYCADAKGAIGEFARILKKNGRAVLVFTHPCFWGSGTDWRQTPPDTPHREDWLKREVGEYFDHTPHRFIHPDYRKPFVYFPRTLEDYFSIFTSFGFRVTHLMEPTIASERKTTVSPSLAAQAASLPTSIVFRLERT